MGVTGSTSGNRRSKVKRGAKAMQGHSLKKLKTLRKGAKGRPWVKGTGKSNRMRKATTRTAVRMKKKTIRKGKK